MLVKDKGLLRYVDELGRVVIPIEIRKIMRIQQGDILEFSSCGSNSVLLKKFCEISEIIELVMPIIKIARLSMKCDVVLIDTQKVVSRNDDYKSDYGEITSEIRQIIEHRSTMVFDDLVLSDKLKLKGKCILQPVVSDGDVLGAVVVTMNDSNSSYLATIIAGFIIDYFR